MFVLHFFVFVSISLLCVHFIGFEPVCVRVRFRKVKGNKWRERRSDRQKKGKRAREGEHHQKAFKLTDPF